MQTSAPARSEIDPADKWDLRPLFQDEAAWEAAFARMREMGAGIAGMRPEGGLGRESLLRLLRFFEEFGILSERLGEYAFLRQSEDEGDSASRERLTRFSMTEASFQADAAWFEPAIQSLDAAQVMAWAAEPDFAPYAVYLRKLLRWKPHILGEGEERLMALQAEPGRAVQEAFSLLTNVDLDFGSIDTPEGAKPLTQTTWMWFMQHPDRSLREKAYRRFYGVFDAHKNALAALYQGSCMQDRFEARARNFPSCRARALFPDAVGEEVYEALVESVGEGLPALHRYYGLKRRRLGLPDFRHWDAYVPMLPGISTDYPFPKAVETVLEALAPLGPEYVDTLRKGLESGWVDRYENRGKHSGAFSSGSYAAPPYILLNYQSSVLRDLYTLAHEAGHSMHSYYSSRSNPFYCYRYSIFEAEVASTFNEELLFASLFSKAGSRELKAYLLNLRLDNVIGTIFRQTMFAEYEAGCHAMLEAERPLTLEALRSLYRGLLQKYFGPDTVLESESDLECLRIPHFYRAFYVYKYSTGLAAAMSLSRRVLRGGEAERKDYFAFLRSGGSRYPIESLRLAGVDMASSEPVRTACRIFAEGVEELEGLLS